ncbi:hypothetical protein DYE49_08880 [Treponema rectale]|uniref:Lipoprotein n=1 Tax=Treponema rectale TaxID=744512 RepID=A0A840SDN7_9SPIR|nr:hypothetical protein [Treponema rectale]MBB5217703.1 hypothetical protein [Treponema rectale]QOS40568.1 hypothetical protein DYE49_08880 [Treponema rectale]
MRKFCFIMLGLVLTFFTSCSNPVSEEESSFVVSFNAGVLKNVIDTNEWFSDCTDVSFRIELFVFDYDNMKADEGGEPVIVQKEITLSDIQAKKNINLPVEGLSEGKRYFVSSSLMLTYKKPGADVAQEFTCYRTKTESDEESLYYVKPGKNVFNLKLVSDFKPDLTVYPQGDGYEMTRYYGSGTTYEVKTEGTLYVSSEYADFTGADYSDPDESFYAVTFFCESPTCAKFNEKEYRACLEDFRAKFTAAPDEITEMSYSSSLTPSLVNSDFSYSFYILGKTTMGSISGNSVSSGSKTVSDVGSYYSGLGASYISLSGNSAWTEGEIKGFSIKEFAGVTVECSSLDENGKLNVNLLANSMAEFKITQKYTDGTSESFVKVYNKDTGTCGDYTVASERVSTAFHKVLGEQTLNFVLNSSCYASCDVDVCWTWPQVASVYIYPDADSNILYVSSAPNFLSELRELESVPNYATVDSSETEYPAYTITYVWTIPAIEGVSDSSIEINTSDSNLTLGAISNTIANEFDVTSYNLSRLPNGDYYLNVVLEYFNPDGSAEALLAKYRSGYKDDADKLVVSSDAITLNNGTVTGNVDIGGGFNTLYIRYIDEDEDEYKNLEDASMTGNDKYYSLHAVYQSGDEWLEYSETDYSYEWFINGNRVSSDISFLINYASTPYLVESNNEVVCVITKKSTSQKTTVSSVFSFSH